MLLFIIVRKDEKNYKEDRASQVYLLSSIVVPFGVKVAAPVSEIKGGQET